MMTVGQKLLRFFHPEAEMERMEYRYEIARNVAHAEDLTRTIVNVDAFELRNALRPCVKGDS